MTDSDRAIPGYALHRVLGRGNTSAVHLAIDPEGRKVALKIPHTETLRVQDAAERFANEVRLSLKFRHPRLVRGWAGTPHGQLAFLSMEFYPKGSLSDHLEKMMVRRLELPQALRILADVASALSYLHKQGAVHQDVKTHNVYLNDEGRAALGDMGSTYFVAQGGKVSGSPYYMAPEIYHGETSSSASDVYSLGILMYELLGGDRPFNGNTYEELMVAHLTRFPVSLSHINPEVARSVAKMAELALAKRPNDRPTAEAIRREILLALGEIPAEEGGEDETRKVQAEPAKNVGRHGTTPQRPVPRPTEAPAPPAKAEKVEDKRGWNPFRRRK
ncbi:serine/threonine-protein kinase [Deinococcus metalli]|uniref:Serine/threonine-protein kinase n=1 Tax=Deinococcus metalli TaxID=1141878 RepID=A0A7W8NS12_9DEIO|nr:serine/threonine-protein kinase [Deinococcus metalli]MBB5378440.1 serine/threonine-protein kinase [Deinococcus metalli]GHF58971.1 serine/threonine protein kinase [Deinococcus metalli]